MDSRQVQLYIFMVLRISRSFPSTGRESYEHLSSLARLLLNAMVLARIKNLIAAHFP
jgi:hypothetical protein